MNRLILVSLGLVISGVSAAETQLYSIEVEASEPADNVVNTSNERGSTTGDTLGGYLDALPNVDSASYG